MTWNYRIVKEVGPEGGGYYLYEVHYNDSGEVCGITEQPSSPFGETPEELISDLENMLKEAKSQSILEQDKIKFASMDD